jgi:hypothetical protein
VHPLGLAALDLRQRVHVRADLQQGACLRVSGEVAGANETPPKTNLAAQAAAEEEEE